MNTHKLLFFPIFPQSIAMVLSCCPLPPLFCGGGDGVGKAFTVTVVLLDRSELEVDVNAKTTGADLMEAVFDHLNLTETAYFGFRFQDGESQTVNRVLQLMKV